jgi:hypothetical protein
MLKLKSFHKREEALKKKLTSRSGLFKYLRAEHSLINSENRYWLIVFSRGSKASAILDKRIEWLLKFWVWDSYEDKLVTEQIIQDLNPDRVTPFIGGAIDFVHILQKEELVILKLRDFDPGIYRFNGEILQTPGWHENESDPSWIDHPSPTQYILNKTATRMLLRSVNGKFTLYQLDKQKVHGRLCALNVDLIIKDEITIKSFEFFNEEKLLLLHLQTVVKEFTGRRSMVSLYHFRDFDKTHPNDSVIKSRYDLLGTYISYFTDNSPELIISEDKSEVTVSLEYKGTSMKFTALIP